MEVSELFVSGSGVFIYMLGSTVSLIGDEISYGTSVSDYMVRNSYIVLVVDIPSNF